MLILLYLGITRDFLPMVGAYAQALLEPSIAIIITIASIILLFASVGVRISNNLASTCVGGIFQVIGYTCRTLIRAIGWIVRTVFGMVPRIFNGCQRLFSQVGMNALASSVLSVLVVVIFLAIII